MNKKSKIERIEDAITNSNINFATGIPCGVLKDIISVVSNESTKLMHVRVQNEPEAIGVASGAALAGKLPLVYMQNSGLLKSINDICSLPKLYNLPLLMVVSHRGCASETAPQHLLTGKITEEIINAMEIPKYDLTEDSIEEAFYDATTQIKNNVSGSQAIILAKRGWDASFELKEKKSQEVNFKELKYTKQAEHNKQTELKNNTKKHDFENITTNNNIVLNREKTLDCIMHNTNAKTAIIATTGLISRSLYENYDASNIFYNVGGFGMASSIGLGFALSKPEVKTMIIDGDCSLLTNFGSMISIGNAKPKNLIHIIIDNNSYGSCSEEKSCSLNANFSRSAILHGYKQVYTAFNNQEVSYSIQKSLNEEGPTLIHIPIQLGGRRDFKRPQDPIVLAQRFTEYFNNNK
jgi:phosphonopyruvate decarboxylase